MSDSSRCGRVPLPGFGLMQAGDSAGKKKETGKSAQEYIQWKVIDLAKEKVVDFSKSISEVSYEMCFKYPPHFTRFFKQWVGQSPSEYRIAN